MNATEKAARCLATLRMIRHSDEYCREYLLNQARQFRIQMNGVPEHSNHDYAELSCAYSDLANSI